MAWDYGISDHSSGAEMTLFDRTFAIALFTTMLFGCNAKIQTKEQPRLSPVQIFDLRTKCQAIVDKDLQDYGLAMVGAALTANTLSHYNPTTNHCYLEIVTTKQFSYEYAKVPTNYRSDALYDAQTRDLLLFAKQEENSRIGNDWSGEGTSFIEYDKATEKIQRLMTQE